MKGRNVTRFARCSFATITAVVLGGSSASAQAAAEGFSLGIGGGFSQGPASAYGPRGTIGYHFLGTLEFPSPVRAFRLRSDGLFADWGGGRVGALTGNLIFTPISGRRVAPYVLAGGGGYVGQGSGVKPGWNVGAGLRLPGELRTIVLESRMHVFRAQDRYPGLIGTDNKWKYVFTPIGFAIQF